LFVAICDVNTIAYCHSLNGGNKQQQQSKRGERTHVLLGGGEEELLLQERDSEISEEDQCEERASGAWMKKEQKI
jgi:hypothetical protein